jgi:ketosteroid isomerase-like protein
LVCPGKISTRSISASPRRSRKAPNADFFSGREAIQGFFQGAIDGGIKGLNLSTLELEVQDDTAHEVGTYELIADGGAVADSGKFIVIWKRVDGSWRLHRDMINTSRPADAN